MKDHERFMMTAEVAELLRMPVESVRWWRHVGKGPKSFKLGRRVLYAREDVEEFIEKARLGRARRAGAPRLDTTPISAHPPEARVRPATGW